MTIGNLINEMESELRKSKAYLQPYMHLYEVKSFVERRTNDLKKFKQATANYSIIIDVLHVQKDLKARFTNESKIFGGMCLKGADYFKVTKKILKVINEEKELEIQAFEEMAKEKAQNQIKFDADYAIPDELDSKTFNEIYGEKDAD